MAQEIEGRFDHRFCAAEEDSGFYAILRQHPEGQ
jgi:hypothetical protein